MPGQVRLSLASALILLGKVSQFTTSFLVGSRFLMFNGGFACTETWSLKRNTHNRVINFCTLILIYISSCDVSTFKTCTNCI